VCKVKSEQGYALVSVLLIIVIFMILILSFMGQSFNSVKQNQLVEKSSQSVALAEMGISYYQTAVKNSYIANQENVNTSILQEINNSQNNGNDTGNGSGNGKGKGNNSSNGINIGIGTDLNINIGNGNSAGTSTKTAAEYAQDAVNSMKTYIQNDLSKVPAEKAFGTNASFKLLSQDFSNNIVLTVQGAANGKTTTLSTEMILSPTVSGLDGSEESTPQLNISLSGVISAFDTILGPSLTNIFCSINPSSIDNLNSSCKKISLTVDKTYTENVNNLSGTSDSPFVIYSKNNLAVNGNANNMNYGQIHTDGNLTFGKNMNSASNITLETKKTANFGSQLRLASSKLYANGDLNVDGHLSLDNSSFAVIGGNAVISKHLNITGGSKICVKGNLTASKLQVTGSLYVLGTINGKPSNITTQTFQDSCSSSNPNTAAIEWGNEIFNKINYDYQ
jgi:type II secretory pathway pseudopilin PulG